MSDTQHYRRSDEQAFLPAALEVRDTPPSPIGRAISWSLMLFFLLAVIWALIGRVDIVAVAQGRIIPSGHSKLIQPLESGRVIQIHVTEGQTVKAGERLIELDLTTTQAELARLRQEAAQLKQRQRRLQLLSEWIAAPKAHQDPVTAGLSSLESNLLQSQWREYREHLATLKSELARYRAERDTLEQQIAKLAATLPLISQRADDMQTLLKTNAVARHKVLEVEQERISAQHDLATQRSRRRELQQAVAEWQAKIRQARSEFQRQTLDQLSEITRQANAITQEIIKAQVRNYAQTLTAPVDGVVQQLAIHTIGAIVTPAQELMRIVPSAEQLEVEALIENKDIGFVEEGQRAEVKIDAFPFTKYGTIDAELTDISNDAVMDETKGLVFKARVVLEKTTIQVGKRLVRLTPGMSVTVEAKTGRRRLIEYFLAPLLKYKQESVRER
ncbi:HlyD family type I secretion periplasmic adaptor subunit [Candidatus Endoriftia persephonae]|jgi:hemolysin D|uniref:Membrane fusion protein (MFP) family protein n=2 Tax=Gammaproteobacteria TaxID=1236 RepID=G2FJ51_9GAMM|nr:HlyD family type I secretion periplasmic adaptor subunit [Candidatus Endoriftia persephone]EGW53195.1 leukotoxin secretion protein D [endosymbiont of Tevnia jerichonana (vent Tica)]USF87947.1 HlyD family type I secretion periplasmic adaptor subunit [Candidatus Endoriftia persephone]